MSTRAERVEVILNALIANDGQRDRVALAAAINDALEPMLLADDKAARSAWVGKASNVIALLVIAVALAVVVLGVVFLAGVIL